MRFQAVFVLTCNAVTVPCRELFCKHAMATYKRLAVCWRHSIKKKDACDTHKGQQKSS